MKTEGTQIPDLSPDDSASFFERAGGFFVENNDNYRVSWQEANEKIAHGSALVRTLLYVLVKVTFPLILSRQFNYIH